MPPLLPLQKPQRSGAVWKSRWPSWAPVSNKPTVSVDLKQHFSQSKFAKVTGKRWWRVRKKWKMMEEEKKVFLHCFLSDWNVTSLKGNCSLGHPIAPATSSCLLADTLWLWAFKNAFKVGTVNFAYSLSPASIVKKVCTGSVSVSVPPPCYRSRT